MRVRIWVTIAAFVPLALLAAANWSRLREPVDVDLFLLTVRWPVWPVVLGLPALLTAVYLGAALLDRARTLRQVAALERQLEEARRDLDRGREAALDAVAERLHGSIAGLESAVEGSVSGLEMRLADRLRAIDGHLTRVEEEQRQRVEALAARVAAVRDELAADVGEVEDTLLRALRGDGDPDEVEAEEVRPALPRGSAP